MNTTNNNQAQAIIRRRKNPRYKNFDYSSDGYYYATICADKKRHLWGEVISHIVVLNDLGQVIENNIRALNELPGVTVAAYIIMPNHLHMLLEIANCDNSTQHSLSALVGRLKSKVIVDYAKHNESRINNDKIWQRNYYDHIIRKQEEIDKIAEYITRNAEFWGMEQDNPENDCHSVN